MVQLKINTQIKEYPDEFSIRLTNSFNVAFRSVSESRASAFCAYICVVIRNATPIRTMVLTGKRSWNIIFILVWFSSDNNLFIVL